jgi:ADP-dependent NAD(P)H-hydrate dehydratase / NAD(P)H-hydrate epimerase
MLEGLPVVTAQEMTRVENIAYADGASEQHFMENAGDSIAEITEDFVESHQLQRKVSLIAGKGNNGGDAFASGLSLLDKGFSVSAWHIYPPDVCSPLCQQMLKRFQKKGGTVHPVDEERPFIFHPDGVILDGLVGTGFKGKAEGILAKAIEHINRSHLPVLAIDIPSGVNGATGAVESVAIHATQTIYLEFPKLGFFLKEGWNHVGQLVRGTFGLEEKYRQKAKPSAYLFDTNTLGNLLPPIKRNRHKYEAGYVLGFAGSKSMPGAALLSSFSALMSGAGIVRLFHPKNMDAELSAAPYELIKEQWDGKALQRIKMESERAKALFVGPGMGRTKATELAVKTLLANSMLPMVLDADALYFLAQNPQWVLPDSSILTPHHGEMHTLLATFNTKSSDPIQAYVNHKQATVVLKGAPTFIYHPKTAPLIVARGDPGMATAGSGDVLTGMIAAMLAQGLEPQAAACAAVSLHAIAGEIAADSFTSYSVTASKIMECIPDAFSTCIIR